MAIALTMNAACFAEGGDDASRQAFRTCDAQAFLALSMARNYLMSGRNKALVAPYLESSAEGQAMAEELYLSALTRMPADAEVAELASTIAARPPEKKAEVLTDYAWALITSVEFRFSH